MSALPPDKPTAGPRRRLEGLEAVDRALAEGAPVAVVILPREPHSPSLAALRARAERAGTRVWVASEGDLRRMSSSSSQPASALAVLGPPPTNDLPTAMGRGGLTCLLHRAAYPSNVGFTIRTVEVAGADALVVDAPGFNHSDRSRASHVSMGADRILPVVYGSTEATIATARQHGHRIVAVEDSGARPPWQVDLTGQALLMFGNERHGIPPSVLACCDDVVRIPMQGFVPSYSLQAAVSAIMAERLRQLEAPGLPTMGGEAHGSDRHH